MEEVLTNNGGSVGATGLDSLGHQRHKAVSLTWLCYVFMPLRHKPADLYDQETGHRLGCSRARFKELQFLKKSISKRLEHELRVSELLRLLGVKSVRSGSTRGE